MRHSVPLLGSIALLLHGASAFAWQVSLQEEGSVAVNSQQEMQNVYPYLVWYDKDTQKDDERFFSWSLDKETWHVGIAPILTQPLNLTPFDIQSLTALPKECPKDHRCFLAMVAVAPDKDPVDSTQWVAASLLPLTVAAGRDRLPGQQFFLSTTGEVNRGTVDDEVLSPVADTAASGAEEPAMAPVPASENKDSAPAEGSAALTTEKPDIFSLVGSQLLYVNNQAQRFQVVDLTDPVKPRLTGEIQLKGNPLELYVLDDYYVLLQTDYSYEAEAKSQLTVIQQAANGQLSTVQELPLTGRFLESRRRGQIIYTVTEDYTPYYMDVPLCPPNAECENIGPVAMPNYGLNISALQLTNGQLTQIDKAQLQGYSPVVAIFSDHLVIANHNPQEMQWQTTQIQVFDLAQTADPLVELPTIKVLGQVPSEFHLSVKDQQLRVVYGPAERTDGSTLAIYDLTAAKPTVIGEVGKIAPGEDLFATRFTDNRAFVVTYERKDPLWVLDLTEATSPKILGELEVPGWSEKMFFHEDKLFAIGMDDQPLPTEGDRWVRRVAISLFDVADPTKPAILNKLIPLAGQVSSSWSLALDDEQALLLKWDDKFAALPIESWETTAGSHLQIVSFAQNLLEDEGLVSMPISVQRSLEVTPGILAALGDQALLTLQWGNGKPTVLAELELAINAAWLELRNNTLWAAALGQQGYNHFYQYTTTDLTTPAQRWSLPKNYNGIVMNEDMAVFYNYNPLAIQAITLADGQLQPAHALETSEATTSVDGYPYYYWHDRSQPLLSGGKLYVAEQWPLEMPKPVDTQTSAMILPMPENYTQETQWTLRSWDLHANPPTEGSKQMIPGRPVAFTHEGKLVTQETSDTYQLRLNLVTVGDGTSTLVSSRELPCSAYSQLTWTANSLYVSCENTVYYSPYPLLRMDAVDDVGNPGTVEQPKTLILKIDPTQSFAEVGQWTFAGYRYLQDAAEDVVMMNENSWYGGYYGYEDIAVKPAMATTEMSIMPPLYQAGCDIYRLSPQTEPQLLKHLEESCSGAEATALSPTQAWVAKGFAGIASIY